MPYGWKIELDALDISHKVSRFEIRGATDAYCRELSLDLADKELYDSIDFWTLPDRPSI